MRRPMRVWVRSDSAPNSGSMNSASTLSSAITTPLRASPAWKVFFRIRGMMPSYTCQKAQMEKKARPTSNVRFVSSFMVFLQTKQRSGGTPPLR